METKDTTMVTFYQLLGRVFFAAAQADKVVREEEVTELKDIVKHVWLNIDDSTDAYNSDAAFQIEIIFDHLLNSGVIVEGVIQELKDYKKIHSALFTDQIKSLILETVSHIISAFAKRNKSELIFFSQLQFVLKK